jgi:ABC-2 type transport system permease protein
MHKTWKIIKHEYTRHVFKKRFLFSLLSLPILVIAMAFIVIAMAFFTVETAPIGYIDQPGFLKDTTPVKIKGNIFEPIIEFIPYVDVKQAQSDLEAKIIQAYYVIPEDFPKNRNVGLIYLKAPSNDAQYQFMELVRKNIDVVQKMDPSVLARLQRGNVFTIVALDGSREMRQDQWFLIFLPIVAGITFIIVVLTSGGYLLQAVVEEKENRTMEIVITSVTPRQLMVGKTLGNIGVGLTQLVVWLIFLWIGISIAGKIWPVLHSITIPSYMFLIMALLFLPAFAMVAGIMSTIGGIMTEVREAQQISGVFSMLVTIPFYAITPIMMNPNSTLAIILSYFPLSAPITVMLRLALTTIPIWQIALIILMLVISAILSMWFAGRVFRMGMLQYGKRLSFRQLFGKQEAA